MQLLTRRSFMELTAATSASVLAAPAFAAGHSSAEVFTADPQGGLVDSTVIMGENSAVLIDAQFTAPNASALADVIAATGKQLETVFITHMHPDHHLGLGVIMDRFPDARVVADAAVQPGIAAAAQAMLDGVSADAPEGAFASRVVIPDALDADHIMLEGERLDVLDPMHGDTDLISAVHIPALDTLVAADFVYADTFAWTAENTTPERADQWLASLDVLEGIGAATVIPGHRIETTPNDVTGIQQTRAYVTKWRDALDKASSAEELTAMMKEGNEALQFEFALNNAVAAVYP
ncbi:MAG: MBL fold metallo-hydrolase [Pseudomonadota bacterium]